MRYKNTIAGTFSSISLADARAQLKTPSNITAEDDLINEFISSADSYIETRANCVISSSTFEGSIDLWPKNNIITINKNPVTSITKVEYYNSSNVLTNDLVEDTDYIVDTVGKPARIFMINTPDIYERPNAIKITFVSGYTSQAAVDSNIKRLARVIVKDQDVGRGTFTTGTIVQDLPANVDHLLNRIRIDEL